MKAFIVDSGSELFVIIGNKVISSTSYDLYAYFKKESPHGYLEDFDLIVGNLIDKIMGKKNEGTYFLNLSREFQEMQDEYEAKKRDISDSEDMMQRLFRKIGRENLTLLADAPLLSEVQKEMMALMIASRDQKN